MTAVSEGLGRLRRRAGSAWAGSLVLRTTLTTLGLSVAVVGLVATVLLNRVSVGVIEAKQARSLTEATADWEQALRILAAASAGPATASPERIIDGVVADLARNAGNPPNYDILLLRPPEEPGTGPERATNLISPASVPAELARAVSAEGGQLWTSTSALYLDGSSQAAMVIGAPVEVPGAGNYQLFHVFPYVDEERIVGLVRSATLAAGILLVGLLAAVVWFVTRHVAVPIRAAAAVAQRIAAGDLDERIPVRGADEMARLAASFNGMALGLQVQIRELEELSLVQHRFVSDVSHELRTPLSTIRMASDVLHERRGLVDGDTRRAIELLAAQVDRFEALLVDLLEISRMDAGAAEVVQEEFDLAGLVRSLVGAAAPLAQEQGCRIRSALRPGSMVVADRRRTARVVRNLMTNALEYGAGRRIDVLVARAGDAAAVAVRDNGPGIRDDQQRRVFDRFWRADPSRARTLGGTGLGLSIAAEDATLQHGLLHLASKPGFGTLFVLTLPSQATGHLLLDRPIPQSLDGFDALFTSTAEHLAGTG